MDGEIHEDHLCLSPVNVHIGTYSLDLGEDTDIELVDFSEGLVGGRIDKALALHGLGELPRCSPTAFLTKRSNIPGTPARVFHRISSFNLKLIPLVVRGERFI